MSVSVRILRRAQADILEIDAYLSTASRSAADRVMTSLMDAIDGLATHPMKGPRVRDETLRRRGYRFLVCGNYLVFYKAARSAVRVFRVLHKRREYESLL